MKLPDNVRFFLQPIDSEGLAIEYIRRASNVLFVLAALSLFIGLRGESASLFDFLLFAGLGIWLRLSHNVVPAGLLAGITLVLLVDSFLGDYVRVRGVLLRLTVVALAVRSLEATIRLPRFRLPRKPRPAAAKAPAPPRVPAPPPAPAPKPAPPRAPAPAPPRPPAPAPVPAPAPAPAKAPAGPVDSAKDLESMEQLKKLGSDMAKPHSPEFLLGFPTEAAAQEAAAKVRALQFEQVEVKPSAHGADWFVHAEKTLLLTEEALRRLRYHFEKIARAGGGYYDGWGAGVER